MKTLLLFACKHGRPRDLPLLREGARAAGYRFVVALVPLAYPMLLLAALARWMGARVVVVVSDRFRGDRWLAALLGADCARMLWNYADEFPDCLKTAPSRRVCFFEDARQPVQLFRFAPQPLLRPPAGRGGDRIVFVGDVSLDYALPRGLAWWQECLRELATRHGYGFYMTADFERLIAEHLQSQEDRRLARVLTKNLLRLWIVQSTRQRFGNRLQLVGSNWRKHGLDAEPSAYSLQARLQLYEGAAVNLDCGSKSGDSALYPRSSEVISYAGGPLQVLCADSDLVYGKRAAEFCFADETTLHDRIERRLTESAETRTERARWLARHLETTGLTMADSFRTLFAPNAGDADFGLAGKRAPRS